MCMISVVMSTYKERTEYVQQAIQSILNQTFRDFELIVVLDNPEGHEIAKIVSEYQAEDHRVVVLRNDKNLGLANSLNKALMHSKGKFVARMDADDVSHPERLKKQLQYLEENRLDFVGALVRRMDESGRVLENNSTCHYSSSVVMRSLRVNDCVPHPTWFLKKEVYDLLGGYREMPRSEDYDFLLRAVKHGVQIGLCDECLVDYRINNTGISQTGLLEQFLSSRYLASNYYRIEEVSKQELINVVSLSLSEKESLLYHKSSVIIGHAMKKRKKHPITAVALMIKAMGVSKYARCRAMIMFKLGVIRFLYG